jgi:hypothetical protein
MPGQVPLNNAKFTNSPDFNNQAVSGITGSGVFRQFTADNAGPSTKTLNNSDLWAMILLSGNSLVTIPAGISASVGDEIVFVSTIGTISFTTSGGATLLTSNLYTIPAERPARLIYAGSNNWILAGAKTAYLQSDVFDCCSTNKGSLYTLGVLPQSLAYSSYYGASLYTYSGVGGVCVVGGTGYNISSGIATESPCTLVNFTVSYTFYDAAENSYSFYSYVTISILNDSEILGVPFISSSESGVYPCYSGASPINGTYYRASGIYGATNPVCFSNGVVISTSTC